MALTQEQTKQLQELKKQADDFERLTNELPENVNATWCKLVGYMREYHYMDELWDGKELAFCRAGETEALVKMSLTPDKVLVFILGNEAGQMSFEPATSKAADEVIQTIKTMRLPDRILPADNIVISSPGGGRCDLCLWNVDTVAKNDRRVEMSLGFAKCFGFVNDFTLPEQICNSDCPDCGIQDIGECTPGLTADEVTHILFPYWWTKSSRK